MSDECRVLSPDFSARCRVSSLEQDIQRFLVADSIGVSRLYTHDLALITQDLSL